MHADAPLFAPIIIHIVLLPWHWVAPSPPMGGGCRHRKITKANYRRPSSWGSCPGERFDQVTLRYGKSSGATFPGHGACLVRAFTLVYATLTAPRWAGLAGMWCVSLILCPAVRSRLTCGVGYENCWLFLWVNFSYGGTPPGGEPEHCCLRP